MARKVNAMKIAKVPKIHIEKAIAPHTKGTIHINFILDERPEVLEPEPEVYTNPMYDFFGHTVGVNTSLPPFSAPYVYIEPDVVGFVGLSAEDMQP